jgi:hypothetical protein
MYFNQVVMFAHVEWQTSKEKCKMHLIDLYTVSGIPKIHWYNDNHDMFICSDYGDTIKPILRPIKSITRVEAKEIAFRSFGMGELEFASDMYTVVKHNCIEIRFEDAKEVQKVTTVYNNFDITIDDEYTITNNQTDIFSYFIRQGFDVFGWIDKGWAIPLNAEK